LIIPSSGPGYPSFHCFFCPRIEVLFFVLCSSQRVLLFWFSERFTVSLFLLPPPFSEELIPISSAPLCVRSCELTRVRRRLIFKTTHSYSEDPLWRSLWFPVSSRAFMLTSPRPPIGCVPRFFLSLRNQICLMTLCSGLSKACRLSI